MGKLKPGATYIYERVGNIVYGREAGADPSTRKEIGYSFECQNNCCHKNIARNYFLEIKWAAILKEAKINSVLQDAIDRVILIYELSKNDERRDTT